MSATDHKSKDRLAQPDDNGERAGGDTLRAWRETKQYLKDEFRQAGYVAAVIVNIVLWYAANNLLRWKVPFITEGFADVLWAINLSLAPSIVGNALFLAFDPRWFRRAVQIVLNLFGLLSAYVLYRVFPFDFGPGPWELGIRLSLGVVIVGIAIGTIAELIGLLAGKDQ